MKKKHQCAHLDDNGKRCRRNGTRDDVFQNSDHGNGWYVVYTCDAHRTTPAERKP